MAMFVYPSVRTVDTDLFSVLVENVNLERRLPLIVELVDSTAIALTQIDIGIKSETVSEA